MPQTGGECRIRGTSRVLRRLRGSRGQEEVLSEGIFQTAKGPIETLMVLTVGIL